MKLRTLIIVSAVALMAFSPQVCVGEEKGKKESATNVQSNEEIISLEVTGMT